MNETAKHDHLDIDAALSGFFRSEMPQPWPQCRALAQASQPESRSGRHSFGRLALAASILLFFLSYFALSGFFPAQPPSPGANHHQDIGSLKKAHKLQKVAPLPK